MTHFLPLLRRPADPSSSSRRRLLHRGSAGFFSMWLLITAALSPSEEARADTYNWNSNSSAAVFSDPANWRVGGVQPATAPDGDDIIGNPNFFGNLNVDNSKAVQGIDVNYSGASAIWRILAGSTNTTLTLSGSLSKSGSGRLAFRDSGGLTLALDLELQGGIVLDGGALDLGEFNAGGATNGRISSVLVTGQTTIISGNLWVNSPSAHLGVLNMTEGQMTVYQTNVAASAGGASVTSLVGGNANAFVQGSGTGNSTTGLAATLTITGETGTSDFSGTVRNGGSGTTLAIAKTGASTQILSGNANTYSGGTTVNAGTLIVSNTAGSATGTGVVTIGASGTLASGNTGIISGNTTVNGNLAVGSTGVGLMTFEDALTLNGTTSFDLGAGTTRGTTYDALDVDGAFTLGGLFELNFTALAANGTEWNLFGGAYGNTIGDFSGLSILGSYSADFAPALDGETWSWTSMQNGAQAWTFNQDSGLLAVVAVPEPSATALLIVFGIGGLIASRNVRRRLRN